MKRKRVVKMAINSNNYYFLKVLQKLKKKTKAIN